MRDVHKQNFDAWFGNSKVVDAEGKPLVVYHGTQASFSSFDPETQGSTVFSEDVGFFFTNDPIEANGYAALDWDKDDPKPNVMPVLLSLQNPLVVELHPEQSPYDSPAIWYDHEGRDEAERAQARGHDGLIIQDLRDDVNEPIAGVPYSLFVAFHPAQIKSAIGNSGLYAVDNPDITDRVNDARKYLEGLAVKKAAPHA